MTRHVTQEKAGTTRLFLAVSIIVLALTLVFITVFSYRYGWQWIDSDSASEMILGKLLAAENTFVSGNWFYSTEIRLVYQTIFTMPLFKLLGRYDNWALIRALNILLNNLVLILSYFFMTKSMKIRTKWVLLSGIFLLMPLSVTYWDIVSFGGYYIFFIAQFFFCLGFFVRFAFRGGDSDSGQTHNGEFSGTQKRSSWVSLIVFLLLSFALGVQTVRSLLIIYIPLLIACVYMWHHGKRPDALKRLLFPGFCGFAANCAGYSVNGLLHTWYSFKSYGSMRMDSLSDNFFPKLGENFAYLAGFFGFSAGTPFSSVRGLFCIAAIIGTILLFRGVYKAFRRAGAHNGAAGEISARQFIPVLFFVSAVFNIFIFIITNQPVEDRYLIPFMVLCFPVIAVFLEYAGKSYGNPKRAAIICGITLFIIGQGALNFQSMVTRDINTVRKGYIQYLVDNKLDYGFATYWNANVTTELSNGRIEMAGLESRIRSGANANQFRILPLLIPKKYLDPLYHRGEAFLLLSSDEWDLVKGRSSFSGRRPDYKDDNFVLFRYPSAQIIHRDVLAAF